MLDLPNYTLTEKIREGASTVTYRGQRSADKRPVMIKVLTREYPTVRELATLEHEYRLLASVDLPSVVKVYALERLGNSPAIVMEDVDGEPLDALIASRRLDLATTLKLALSVATTLSDLYKREILHKDIKPSNIVCNLSIGQTKLIDFSLATRKSQETSLLPPFEALDGTFAYMAPEQTGRMNRGVDHRTDLYAFGVTLYEMLTGVLPFQSHDPVELVHSHIAKTPTSPKERSPEVPEVLSDIVMKLLAKAAEDRYQRAEGLAADLSICAERLREGSIAPFPLGERDRSDVLSIPHKLYGREEEMNTLMRAFDRAAEGRPLLLLVAGPAGVGKSSLVHEIQRAIARRGGDFVDGKFDQLHKSAPFDAFTQAFRELIRHLLTRPPPALEALRNKLLAALGKSGRVLVDLIPELSLVLGPQPEVPHLGPAEAQNRLGLLFQAFVRVFCDASHPLVVFLDDLQWADPGSLLLLKLLLADPEGGHLLLIGAYRDRDVGAAHPLLGALAALRKDSVPITSITLDALDLASARALVADALGASRDEPRIGALAEQLFGKTHGNPFFLTQLLVTLGKEGLLSLDGGTGRWTWDGAAIAATPIAENVVEFMAEKLQRLSPSTQRVLSLAACAGHTFDLTGLSTIAELSPEETAEHLWPAVREGLLVPLDKDYRARRVSNGRGGPRDGNMPYRFLHDRVQQAAYSLISEANKEDVHLRIGRLLRARLPAEPSAEALFEVVHQLNRGLSRILAQAERRSLAEDNLMAGRRAKERAAYATAADFFDAGLKALDDAGALHDLSYALYRERAECLHLSGRYEEAREELDHLLSYAASTEERVTVHILRILLCLSQGRFDEGMAAGRAGLELLGVTLPDRPEQFLVAFEEELRSIDQRLAGRSIESLVDLPPLPAEKYSLLRLIREMYPLAYWLDARMAAFIAAKGLSLSLEHGNANDSLGSYIGFGLLIIGMKGRFEDGIRFGRIALRLLDRFGPAEAASSHFVYGLYAAYGEPMSAAVDHLRKAREAGFESGSFFFLSHASAHISLTRYRHGDALSAVEEECEKSAALLLRTRDLVAPEMLRPTRQAVACLTGRTHGRTSFSDSGFEEGPWIEQVSGLGQLPAAYLYYLMKLQIAVLYDDHERARAMADAAWAASAGALGTHASTDLHFYPSLAMAGRYPEADADEKARLLGAIERDLEQLNLFYALCPENEGHRRALIRAELARLKGDFSAAAELYDEASSLAEQNGFVQHEALANELAAKFYLARGRRKLARVYMADARHAYSRWGATSKVKELDERYPELHPEGDEAEDPAPSLRSPTVSIDATETRLSPGSGLDLSAVLLVTQAIGSEIVLDKLLDRLMRIVLANAGAQVGALVLRREDHLLLAATATVSPDEVMVGLSEPVEGSTLIPLSVIQYVARTREPVVLSPPEDDARFSEDPYIRARRPRSILALALTHHGSMAGVLYLENNAVHSAFHEARVELLSVLSAPAAIAVENALLYADVRAVSADLARSNELLLAANEKLSEELAEHERLKEAQVRMQEEIIQAQKDRLSELSTPLIPITDRIMVMPLIGTIDEARSAQMLEAALAGVVANRAEVVIIDVTGVKVVETPVAVTLVRLAAALRLLGTEVVITGIRPAIAAALVALGIDLGPIATLGSLKSGIAHALGRTRELLSLKGDKPQAHRS